MVKQVQQDCPMHRHPDRSCTYLVLRATPDERSVQLKPALKFPRGGAAKDSSSDQHLDKHWPGGVKIKMTLGMCDSQRKKARWQMVKPRLGLARGVLFKANCPGVPIITQPRKERKIREHNIDMTETRAARVEQKTRREAEPSTLYQVYRCIKITR